MHGNAENQKNHLLLLEQDKSARPISLINFAEMSKTCVISLTQVLIHLEISIYYFYIHD